ncbi:MAG TPA: Flp family type IVb pilin [Tepidisphaeraceae bacterium]|nr:Flp family type IVb pilin [Tepidisphaeraceae bacterium]
MTSLKNLWVRLVKDEEGASLIEYVLLAALIGVAAIAGMTAVGDQADSSLSNTAQKMVVSNTN